MFSAVGVRVVEPVTVQTQPLGAGGALSVHSRGTTDAASFYSHRNTQEKDIIENKYFSTLLLL